MRRHAVNAGRLGSGQHGAGKRHHRRFGWAAVYANMRPHNTHHRLMAASHHGGKDVNEPGFGNFAGGLFIVAESRAGNKRCQCLG